MKMIIALLLMSGCLTLHAQHAADKFVTGTNDQARDPRVDQQSYVPNEVIVKFREEVPLKNGALLRSAGVASVDQILQAFGVDSLVRLFPTTKSNLLRSTNVPRIVKDPQGRDMVVPDLNKIFKITFPQLRSTSSTPVNIYQVIKDLKELPEVEYAEPNYIYTVDDLKSVGPVLTADEVKNSQRGIEIAQTAVVPNDPLYAQQWYIPAVKADLVWSQTTGDTTQVIGILDTGVDWNHPDLKNKIWTNPGEIPGNGIDDDGNGLIDDIRGWDYINNDNNPMDDNSHGTHVAGIAAAEANNGIGIVGVNWNAKIMPLKVFQSSGRGDAANIAKAIIYATNKGAMAINMSFGSYARSMAMEDALINAYTTSILVAAAGNDGLFLEVCPSSAPFYPACFSFVIGVQAPEASFSNGDCNGATYSENQELFNYEAKAPGTNVLSTVPNGNYRLYQGTSMAAPIVSAALSLYRSLDSFHNESTELMWVKFIQSTDYYIDFYKMMSLNPIPEVRVLSKNIVDTLVNDDSDTRVDAGEHIQLWLTVRNTGGYCDSTWVKLRLHEFEDETNVELLNSTVLIGPMSSYATLDNKRDPIEFKISPFVSNNRDIVFDLLLWSKTMPDTLTYPITFTVENGEELEGVMDSTLTLTPDKLWLINGSFRVGLNGILNISPGTVINNNAGLYNRGQIIANGTKDSVITICGSNIDGPGSFNFKHTNFNGLGSFGTYINGFGDYVFETCIFEDIYTNEYFIFTVNNLKLSNCIIKNCSSKGSLFRWSPFNYYLLKNNIVNCKLTSSMSWAYRININEIGQLKYNNISKIREGDSGTQQNALWSISGSIDTSRIQGNSIIGFNHYELGFPKPIKPQGSFFVRPNGESDICNFQNQYWGSIDLKKIKEDNLYDFFKNSSLPMLEVTPFLAKPAESCHAITWKILVNGKDAQDEQLDPLGAGIQRFDVFFNRPMDKTITPLVSFGVRFPYSQQQVGDNGSWSADGRIYTVYKDIKLTTGDGINRIRVSGAKDLEGWIIPTEDMRFEFLISAASSSSLDFMATPGLGKVKLEWNNNDLADGLGYNLYRMEHINDSTLTDPVMINASLINDTLYTDYSVVPNIKYYYAYKVVRTDLSETDPSKVVSATPFTASKGDANGDLSVNVLDITTIVAYLLNNNPQPFINEAADLNSDGNINVLDIVSVVNNVLYGGLRSVNVVEDQQVRLNVQNDTLFADATTAIGGLQFDLAGATSINDVQVLDALKVFESGYSQRDNSTLRLLYYSMSGKSIEPGSHIPLLKLSKSCNIKEVIVSDKTGASIPVSLSNATLGSQNDQGMIVAELGQNYPNPAKGQSVIPVQIFEKVDEASIIIFNMLGQLVNKIELDNLTVGKREIVFQMPEARGLYLYKLETRSGAQVFVTPFKKMLSL